MGKASDKFNDKLEDRLAVLVTDDYLRAVICQLQNDLVAEFTTIVKALNTILRAGSKLEMKETFETPIEVERHGGENQVCLARWMRIAKNRQLARYFVRIAVAQVADSMFFRCSSMYGYLPSLP